MTNSKTASQRNLPIDVMKGLFVLNVASMHVMAYTSPPSSLADNLWAMASMVTFSGFVFCMGYVIQLIYYEKSSPSVSTVLRSFSRSLFGYYLSAFAYFFIYKSQADWPTIFSVLVLQQFGSLSEFLLAFALFPLVAAILTHPIKAVIASERLFYMVYFLLLMTTFIPNDLVTSPYIALWIGGTKEVYYPILQYFPLFLLGAYFASRRLEPTGIQLVFGILALLVFEGFMLIGGPPSRFPPSFTWVVCSIGGALVWYWASLRLAAWRPAASILAPMGANSLFFLVVTNIIVFGLGRGLGLSLRLLEVVPLAILVIASTYFLMTIVRHQKV
jgi:hypothetical protein